MLFLKQTFSKKLTFIFFSLIFLAVSIPGYFLSGLIKDQFIQDLQDNLSGQATLMASQLEPEFFHGKVGAASHQAKKLAEICGCRVTFIRKDGVVLEDSDVPLPDLAQVENHGRRAEVLSALSGQPGFAIRFSQTVGKDMLYAAVPFYLGDQLTGAIRLALPLTGIQTKLAEIQIRVLWMALVMLAVAWVVAMLVSRSISRPVTEMSLVAESLGQGKFEKRVPRPGSDELGRLGQTLNNLADKIQKQIQEISHEKSHLSATLDHMTDGVVVVDPSGRIITANLALAAFFGVVPSEIQGKIFLEALRQSQLNELIQSVRQEFKEKMIEIRTFNPTERIFEAQAVPMLSDEKLIGIMLVLHDISEIRRLEQVRRDFIANVSHELRTPLASIKGFAETLLMGGLEDKENRTSFVKSIEQQSNRMTSLVTDLLDLSAIESGRRVPQKTKFSLNRLIEEVTKDLKNVAHKMSVHLSAHLPQEDIEISADKTQIHQVVTNLVENGLKFNHEKGSVKVSLQRHEATVELKVTDTGIGIPSQDVGRIFERFYRVDKARSRDMGGTGLGLSIVKHIVEAHNGTIHVESQLGKGSAFTLLLPII